jgi:hypothetical protein
VFALLYTALAVTDFVLIRRYARLDPPPARAGAPTEEGAVLAAG